MKQALLQFNRGRIDPLALARVDQERVAISAETMTNWIPRILGPMSLRPGLGYIASTNLLDQAWFIPFVFSTTDTALIELTANTMRVLVDDSLVTRPTVTTVVVDPDFSALGVVWIENHDVGGSASVASGALSILGNGSGGFGIVDQAVSVVEDGTEHALRVVIENGPVVFKCGSTQGDDDYISETNLGTGTHSITFTPYAMTTTFHIRFMNELERTVKVDHCQIDSSGVMTLPTPWGESDLPLVRNDQSADVVYCACENIKQMKIERRGTRSWSVVEYRPTNGPFKVENTGPITITPGAISGNTTLGASKPLFKSTNVGSLYRLESVGQTVEELNATTGIATDSIKVTGITSSRIFTIDITDTWTGQVKLQRSLESDTGPWADVPSQAWTANITKTYDDGLDNQIVWYRLEATSIASGNADLRLVITTGSIIGTVRVLGFTSSTSVTVEVIDALGNTAATKFWREGEWSDRRGWPTCTSLHEGRLWWAGKDKIIGSISDAFESFDPDFEGDAGTINRTVGSGPVDSISWGLSLQRLILGGDGAEHSVRSSSFDEPITPTDFMLRAASTQGSAKVPAVKIDQEGIFIQKSGTRVYQTIFDGSVDYEATDLTLLVPEMGEPSIVRVAVQRKPDTRIHCVRSDGTVMLGVYDRAEDVLAWIDIETDGLIEDVTVLPGTIEDNVYYSINRTIGGSEFRYIEKWALESTCRGGLINKQADSFIVYDGVATTTITGLSHIDGESVCVWADGKDVGTVDYAQIYTVAGGKITLATAASQVVVGLPYTADFKSAKLGQQIFEHLNVHKKIERLGLTLAWVHAKGLRFGQFSDRLDSMPEVEGGKVIDPDVMRETYTEQEVIVPGGWGTDARLYLKAQSPRPCTVMAAVPDMAGGR